VNKNYPKNRKPVHAFEQPKIVITPKGGDLAAVIQMGLSYRKYVDNEGESATVIDLGYPFVISEDAQNIAIQVAHSLYRTCKPKAAAAMAFQLFTNDYGQRIRLVIAMIIDNGAICVTVDNEWFAVPKSIDVFEPLADGMNPYQLWTDLVQQSGLDHVERVRMLIDRAYRELKFRGRSLSHSHATAAMYD
jgi:hypothetical protein